MAQSRGSRKATRQCGTFGPANRPTANTLFSAAPKPAPRLLSGEWIPTVATHDCSRVVLTIKEPTIRNGYQRPDHRRDLSSGPCLLLIRDKVVFPKN